MYWCDESHLEGRADVRPRQRAGQGVLARPRTTTCHCTRCTTRTAGASATSANCEIAARSSPTRTSTRPTTTASAPWCSPTRTLTSLPAERSREIDVVEFVPSEQVDPMTLDKATTSSPTPRRRRPTCCCARRSSRPIARRSCGSRCARRPGSRRCACAATCSCCRRCCGPTRCARPRSRHWTSRCGSRRRSSSCRHPSSRASQPTSIPSEFVDEYQEELRTLIEAKIEQGDALDTSETFGEQREEEAGGEVIDLMEALRASVGAVARGPRGQGRDERQDAAAKAATKASDSLEAARPPNPRRPRSPRRRRSREGVLRGSRPAEAQDGRPIRPLRDGARGRARRPRGRGRAPAASSWSVMTSWPAAAAFLALERSLK